MTPAMPKKTLEDIKLLPSFTDLLSEAQRIVEGKYIWKKFIDGTPLANDIAVWMVEFAQDKHKKLIWSLANKINGELCDKVGILERDKEELLAKLKTAEEALDLINDTAKGVPNINSPWLIRECGLALAAISLKG